jgi:crotonobetainyl-CoA:carnitine CoA-transferase CaiB-like acyl-CoA transferase
MRARETFSPPSLWSNRSGVGTVDLTFDPVDPRRRRGDMGLPLSDVRIVDMTQALAGPYGAKILGDLGAEVIKVEMPGEGDMTRKFAGPSIAGESGYFMAVNRNKKSITLNLRSEKAKEIFKGLVKVSDVVFENFRPDTTKKMGLDYESLKQVNPKIIYCALSGFGSQGPYKHRPAFDYIIQALAGVMSVVGEPGRPPVHTGVPIADLNGGIFGALAILTALYAREKTGEGQYIDLSMLDLIFSMWAFMGQFYLISGDIPRPVGSGHVTNVPLGAFKAKDGYVVISAPQQKFYENLANVLAKEVPAYAGLPDDERFRTPAKRLENREELERIINDALSTKSRDEWLKLLEAGDVPAAPVNNVAEAFSDPQVLFRNMIVEFDHPTAGKVKTVGNPFKFSQMEREIFNPPPLLGQHNEEIICGLLGYSKTDFDGFKKDKAI